MCEVQRRTLNSYFLILNSLKMRGKEIKKVSDLFQKYRDRLKAPEGSVVDAFIEVVEDLTSIKVERKKVRYTPASKTLSLRGAGVLKSEIKLHEREILNHLKGRLGEKNAPRAIL